MREGEMESGDNVLMKRVLSCIVDRRRSSTDVMDRRKTLVVVIGHGKGKGGKGGRLIQKQRSWETFPPKRRNHHQSSTKFCRDPDSFRGAFELNGLKKVYSPCFVFFINLLVPVDLLGTEASQRFCLLS
jgi:hypothetical protein